MCVRLGMALLLATAWLQSQAASLAHAQEFPFEFREGLLWVEVRAEGAPEPLHFLLDSGAGVSVLDLGTVGRLGLSLARRVSVQGVGASTTGYWPQKLAASAGEIRLPKRFLAVDLSALSQACKCRVDGLIGADFFRERVVQIDFAHKKVRLLPPGAPALSRLTPSDETGRPENKPMTGSVPEPKAGYKPALRVEALPLEAGTGALRVPVRINGRAPQWLRLDTGCASSLQWVTADRPAKSSHYEVAVALTGLSIPVTQTQVQLGSFQFDAVPTGLHERPFFAGEAGLLGNGLLSQFSTVTLDARAGRLVLERHELHEFPLTGSHS
jgi:hypothetical protein